MLICVVSIFITIDDFYVDEKVLGYEIDYMFTQIGKLLTSVKQVQWDPMFFVYTTLIIAYYESNTDGMSRKWCLYFKTPATI